MSTAVITETAEYITAIEEQITKLREIVKSRENPAFQYGFTSGMISMAFRLNYIDVKTYMQYNDRIRDVHLRKTNDEPT